MTRHYLSILAAAALVGACAEAPPERQLIDEAAEALGGAVRIQAIDALVMEGSGSSANLLQNFTPEADMTTWAVTDFRRVIDPLGRMRTSATRNAQFEFALATTQTVDEGLDGDVAYNVGADGAATRASEAAARDRRIELLHHPLTIVRAALDPGARLGNLHEFDNYQVVDVTTTRGDMVTLAIDAQTKLPVTVTSMTAHPFLGDVAVETSFADYEDVDGVRVPRLLRTTIDKYPLTELRITANTLADDAGDLAAPDAVKTAEPPRPPPMEVTADEVAPGIWWLAGSGNHRSVLFEFDDHLTLFEVPLSEARTQAVIARARALRPDKPLTEAIVSHHHPDHAGGVRAAVAEGLTLITQAGNEAFFRALVARRHSIAPDALAAAPRPLDITTFEDERVLHDESMEIRLYRVTNDSHIDNMIFAYAPGPRVLVQADLYDEGWLRQPWALTYLENVEGRELDVETDVPIHGRIQPHAEVVAALEAAATSEN